MDTKQVNDALERLFQEERIVFWNDPDKEFVGYLSGQLFSPQRRSRKRRRTGRRSMPRGLSRSTPPVDQEIPTVCSPRPRGLATRRLPEVPAQQREVAALRTRTARARGVRPLPPKSAGVRERTCPDMVPVRGCVRSRARALIVRLKAEQ